MVGCSTGFFLLDRGINIAMISLLTDHLLSLIIAVPFIGMIVLAFLSERKWVLSVTLAITLINAALAF